MVYVRSQKKALVYSRAATVIEVRFLCYHFVDYY